MKSERESTGEIADDALDTEFREDTMKTDFETTDFDAGEDPSETVPSADQAGHGAGRGGLAVANKKGAGAVRTEASAAQVEGPAPHVETPAPCAARTGPSRRRIVLLAVAIGLFGAAIYFGIPAIVRYFRFESTDDAFINGHVTYISSRVAGRVTAVLVENNQYVEAGQVLARIDREPFQIVVDQKRAALAQAKQLIDGQVAVLDVAAAQARQAHDQARSQLVGLYADYYLLESVQTLIRYEVASLQASVSNWKLQRANLELAQANLRRGKELAPQGAMSQEDLDQREDAVKVAQQQVDTAVQASQQARALLDLPPSKRAAAPDASVPDDINETFPGVKYVVASASNRWPNWDRPFDPGSAKAGAVLSKLEPLMASSFIDHVPAVEVAERSCASAGCAWAGRRSTANIPTISPAS